MTATHTAVGQIRRGAWTYRQTDRQWCHRAACDNINQWNTLQFHGQL